MQIVRLGQYGKDLTISDEAFEVISRIVANHQICSQCQRGYSVQRPQVALNLCLPCFMGGYPKMKQYVGQDMLGEGTDIHLFLDEKGYIHYSTLHGTQLISYTYATLRYWHYPVPAKHRNGTETIPLNEVYWSIESELGTSVDGILQPNQVIVISYTHRAGDNSVYDYFSYRGDKVEFIDKRRSDIKTLFTSARYCAESTMKHPEGGYLLHGTHTFTLTDYDLLEIAADILNERYIASAQEEQA